jgi:uncharacterized protein (DUF2249 family)
MTPPDPRRIAERHGHRSPAQTDPRPAVLDQLRPVGLDVRDDIARGEEPFARIMSAVRALADGEALVLRVPFEPVPLYGVLDKRGLEHWTEASAPGDCTVWFYRQPAREASAAPAPEAAAEVATIDVRGLEPPLPMVSVLERLETLAPGQTLVVLHDRRPMFLYPQLEDRGFAHETHEPTPGVVRIVIRRPAA